MSKFCISKFCIPKFCILAPLVLKVRTSTPTGWYAFPASPSSNLRRAFSFLLLPHHPIQLLSSTPISLRLSDMIVEDQQWIGLVLRTRGMELCQRRGIQDVLNRQCLA